MKQIPIIFLLLLTTFSFASWQKYIPQEYLSFTKLISEYTEVPIEIVAAIGQVESNWSMKKGITNSNGSFDIGFFQLNSNYIDYYEEMFWESQHEFDPYNPYHNIEIGVRYLRWLYEQTNCWEGTIQSYNIGLTAYKKNFKPENGKEYLTKVLSVMLEMNIKGEIG